MTTPGDPTKPDGTHVPAATADAPDSPKDGASGFPAAEASTPKKKIDPWHFGAYTVPPELRAELSAMPLPEPAEERRYRRPSAEATADSPAPPVDTSRADPTVMIRRVKRKDKRAVVGITVGVALLLLLAAAVSQRMGSQVDPPPESASDKPSTEATFVPTKPSVASADPNPTAPLPESTAPAAAPSVSAPLKPPERVRDAGKPGSHKEPSSTSRPAAPTQAKPPTPAPPPSAAPRASSGRLMPADD